MKTRNYLISFVVFVGFGVLLFIFNQQIAAYISIGFAVMLSVTFITTKVMDKRTLKKLDEKYYVLTKEQLLKEYDKLTAEFNKGKLKQVILAYLRFKEEYELNHLKNFGLWLTKTYFADPSGIDGGIVVLFVNVHEVLMAELMKDIKNKIKEENITVDFDYGFAIYQENDNYETLKTKAINNLKNINN